MRRDSCRSVPMICKPPDSNTAVWRSCQSLLRAVDADSFSVSKARTAAVSSSEISPAVISAASSASRLPPRTISVPRPAMLVAMVTAPGRPAFSMMFASRSCCLAFSTSCAIFFCRSKPARYSDVSMEVVPTSTGCLRFEHSSMSSIMASYFSRCVRKTRSGLSSRTIAR